MVLEFKPQFVQPILDGKKIHTIREDKHNRWKAGTKIHFVTGLPAPEYRYFKIGVCTGVQDIEIIKDGLFVIVNVDGRELRGDTPVSELVFNDGFGHTNHGLMEFMKWVSPYFRGKIIHWTRKRY